MRGGGILQCQNSWSPLTLTLSPHAGRATVLMVKRFAMGFCP